MHPRRHRPLCAAARGLVATLGLLCSYVVTVIPHTRRELQHWERSARAIPDELLRTRALETLGSEAMNAEGAAVFATLVPRSMRANVLKLLVAFQVMYDYLDTLGEEPVPDPLSHGLQLHLALLAALDPSEPTVDYTGYLAVSDDGGYLAGLVAACQWSFCALPAAAVVRPLAKRAARRCGEGQSYTHAVARDGIHPLAAWALSQNRVGGYHWWETAAGAISSVGVYALLAAAAADPTMTAHEAARIDAAYFPSICALSTLLDSLIDRARDAETGDYSSIAQYRTDAIAAERLATIARRAEAAIGELRSGQGGHLAIVAGVVGYYLSAAETETQQADAIQAALSGQLGVNVPVILATLRLRRRLGRR